MENKKDIFNFNSAQGAIEYLLITGAAIIVVAIVVVFISSTASNVSNVEDGKGAINTGYDVLQDRLGTSTVTLLELEDNLKYIYLVGENEYTITNNNGTWEVFVNQEVIISESSLLSAVNKIRIQLNLNPISEDKLKFEDHPCKGEKWDTFHPVYGCISKETFNSI